ncbi:hypothetical protein Pan44_00710 [Caulifigura coniformis]|uniref:Uncharacterized protein n=1 Tax=Caulifigura coniformis TaxID=2527983 RepID=A0A517S7H3_9PLAN|nr:hypothetical protein [Caulifigura coniformis]QDT52063.1 hypothetical protein Pan44_00710 [Caulifigura coniformis]
MTANDNVRDLIHKLVASDDPPSEQRMSELHTALEQKVTSMKQRGRYSQLVCVAGIALMILGFAGVLLAARSSQEIRWLTLTSSSILIAGAVVVVAGCVGLFTFRGFGYVWARHDLHDATMMELSLQVQRLSERVDALSKRP